MCDTVKTRTCNCGHHGRAGSGRNDLAILNARFEPTEEVAAAPHQCKCGKRFCPRRVQSVTGLMLGAGLVLHLLVNALGFWPATFQGAVNVIHGLGPVLPCVEAVLIFVPLLVHIGYGLRFLVQTGLKYRVEPHHHGSDPRYLMQRVTAVVLMLFLGFHIATFHRWGLHLASRTTGWTALERYQSGGLFQPEGKAFESASAAIRTFIPGQGLDSPWNLAVVGLYFVGILAAVFHLANGAATAAEVLGFAETEEAQNRYWQMAVGVAVVLLVIGMDGWYAFAMGLHR